MNTLSNFKKTCIAGLLSFLMVFCFSVQPQAYAQNDKSDSFTTNYKVIADDNSQLKISTKSAKVEKSAKSTYGKDGSPEELDSVTATMTLDKETHGITLVTDETSEVSGKNERNYKVVLNDVKANGDINATFTDIETGQSYLIEQDKLQASLVWFIPIGVIIGEWLLSQLLAAALAVTIGGISYVVVSEIATTLRNDNKYDHYMAKIMQGNLWIGNSLTLPQAVGRLVNPMFVSGGEDVWSRNYTLAAEVAKVAGGNRTPVGPELTCNQIPGNFYYTHYHTWNRVGGHSFF
ncbi:SAR2788 family putative toxin [Paenibacillus chitinolyticus]|uniref:SAR2788 family putative toxin n=1 Tax=Paenibacillus chitinolyticus TaxID=79263 RepID=UPI003D001185